MNEKQLEIQLSVPENASYQMVEVDKIRPNPFQPRRIFDKKKLAELADSIRESGIFQPLVLRQPIAAIERYEIIAGERRYRASIIAGLTKVPAIIRDFSDETTREAAIVENLQREDLSPLEEAEAYQAMIQELGLTQAQVSQRLGKSRPYIANYLRLLGLPTMVKQLLQDGKLSMGQARTLLGLKQERQLEQMAQRTVKENLTVRQLEAMVNQINAAKTKKAKKLPQRRRSPFVREIENQLAERLGTKAVVLEKSKQKGKIEIDYESMQDLDRILEILNISID
ncbi:ParB/RepB/Spo0J family partition protein [Pediococcus acidilactici]|uniref:ParB/RepB/Spo0J family partition protein n=1 Tax=Pediococcus acidilactici TaxID=1254 RepID=UPI00232E95D7|nr:ParB/RepB/Spo0J family partition protein [Pediococcus acidilactici]MDB8868668.1 ParB/RepB/Spo0J family partition protein [Pediococcus acidilactici]